MLTIFRRHLKSCPQTSREYRRCRCPIHVEGTLAGARIRKSLDLTSWEAAQALIREWETKGKLGGVDTPDIAEAGEKFIEDAIARGVRDSTLVPIRRVITHFVEWCVAQGLRRLAQIDLEQARKYRATWPYAAVTATKKLERLRGFFRFCVESGWIEKNPFQAVKSPVLKQTPTMPFSDEDFAKVTRRLREVLEQGSSPRNGSDRRGRTNVRVEGHPGRLYLSRLFPHEITVAFAGNKA